MSIWSEGMKLDNPVKFLRDNIDGTLIARGEILFQYSPVDEPEDDDWTADFDSTMVYKWIRISFDYGKSFAFQYKLNNTDISIKFEITNDKFIDSGNIDYPKMYSYEITNEAVFNEIKHKPLGIFVEEANKSTSVLAPVVYRTESDDSDKKKFYLDILVTDLFIEHNLNKICFIKN